MSLDLTHIKMLKSFTDAPLAVSRDGEYGGYYAYLEAWKFSNVGVMPGELTFTVLD
jgi:hypothetical protein